jgi:hypothetical protein
MKLRILIAGVVFAVAALAADSGAELFQKAVTQERAAGNLEEAIKLYQRVAKDFASDRPLAAKALVQAARCYEKLGQDKQDKAVKLYEQVARDFGDQRELSATANARLVVLRQGERAGAPATMTQRKIELPVASTLAYKALKGYVGSLIFPTDGQRVLYRDAATGALMIGDLAGQDKRVLLKPKAGETIENIFPSRDFSSVIVWLGVDGRRKPVMLKTDGTGYRELAHIVPVLRENPGGYAWACGPPDWSWDNRYFFDCVKKPGEPDGTGQVRRVSVADGEIRNIGRAQDTPLNRPSPDGRFIASGTRYEGIGKVWIMPIPAGEPELVSENAHLIDWTRDGRYLIISSSHSGSEALYLLPIKDGKAVGDPVFVHYGPCFFGSSVGNGGLVCHSTHPDDGVEAWLGSLWILENFEPKQQAAK